MIVSAVLVPRHRAVAVALLAAAAAVAARTAGRVVARGAARGLGSRAVARGGVGAVPARRAVRVAAGSGLAWERRRADTSGVPRVAFVKEIAHAGAHRLVGARRFGRVAGRRRGRAGVGRRLDDQRTTPRRFGVARIVAGLARRSARDPWPRRPACRTGCADPRSRARRSRPRLHLHLDVAAAGGSFAAAGAGGPVAAGPGSAVAVGVRIPVAAGLAIAVALGSVVYAAPGPAFAIDGSAVVRNLPLRARSWAARRERPDPPARRASGLDRRRDLNRRRDLDRGRDLYRRRDLGSPAPPRRQCRRRASPL